MRSKSELQQLKTRLFEQFKTLFHDKVVAKKEWALLWESSLNFKDIWQLVTNRLLNVNKVANAEWQEPIHVVATMAKYREISNYNEAISLLEAAKSAYSKFFGKLVSGNLIVDCEVGFNDFSDSTKGSQKQIFNIHAHIICENAAYTGYLTATKHLRVGKSLNNHEVSTRKCFRKVGNETDAQYVAKVANYNNKFALLQGQSRSNRRAQNLPNANEYLTKKLQTSFIRLAKKKNPKLSRLKNRLKYWLYLFTCWKTLEYKENQTSRNNWSSFGKNLRLDKVFNLPKNQKELDRSQVNEYFYMEYDTI